MANAQTRRHNKKCKAMSTTNLKLLIQELEPNVRELTSLLECAKQEKRKRIRIKQEEET